MSTSKSRVLLAEAAEARARRQAAERRSLSTSTPAPLYQPHDKGLDERLKLRSQISKILETHGLSSLRRLLKMATKIIVNPDNDKFRKIKLNNDTVKKEVMRPSGVLEFVIEMGFTSEKVIDFEACRIWIPSPSKMKRLELCKQLLEEALNEAPSAIARRDDALAQARKREEDQDSVARERRRFVDDRRRVRDREERERQRRAQGIEERQDPTQELSSNMRVMTLHDLAANGNSGEVNEDKTGNRNTV